MPSAAMRLAAALVLLVASINCPATLAGAREETRVDRRLGLEVEVVREVNRVRVEHGLPRLRFAPGLRTAARSHSRSMLVVGFFGHDSADGTSFSDRIRRFYGNRGWEAWSVGETLLATFERDTEASAVVSAWLDSPPHREIVLSPFWREVGVGAFQGRTAPGEYGDAETVVVTADFGVRAGKASSS